jgi:methylated-DNA-[protein]-cysteine S-methyltransferase
MSDPKAVWEEIEAARHGAAAPPDEVVDELIARGRQVVRLDPAHRAALRQQLLAEWEARYGRRPAVRLALLETELGWIGLARSDQGIVGLNLPRPTRERALADLLAGFPGGELTDLAAFGDVVEPLRRYAAGQPVRFQVPLDLSRVTPFRRKALEIATRIPYGETRTYAWIAEQIGRPCASRAVGGAMATNPIPIIIPCHRVVASDGSLCGYAGGLDMKKRLLQLEGVIC